MVDALKKQYVVRYLPFRPGTDWVNEPFPRLKDARARLQALQAQGVIYSASIYHLLGDDYVLFISDETQSITCGEYASPNLRTWGARKAFIPFHSAVLHRMGVERD